MAAVYLIGLCMILSSCQLILGQSIHVGSCPSPSVQQDFDFKKFLGRWYEAEKTFALFEEGIRCVTSEIIENENGDIDFQRQGLTVANLNITLSRGKLTFHSTASPAKMSLSLNGVLIPLKYRVLETDYINYGVVWSCLEIPGLGGRLGHIEYLRVLSRHPVLPPVLKKTAQGNIAGNGLDSSFVRPSFNNRCPELIPNMTVVASQNDTDSAENTDQNSTLSTEDQNSTLAAYNALGENDTHSYEDLESLTELNVTSNSSDSIYVATGYDDTGDDVVEVINESDVSRDTVFKTTTLSVQQIIENAHTVSSTISRNVTSSTELSSTSDPILDDPDEPEPEGLISEIFSIFGP